MKTMKLTIIQLLLFSTVLALQQTQPPQQQQFNRREFFCVGGSTAAVVGAAWIAAAPAADAATCVSGVGDACADLAQGNAFIQELQQRSAANKERNEREAREAYYMKNYPDWFQTVGKTLVKRQSDGTFVALSDDEVAALKRDNKLTLETATSMGGRVVDYTQKPILLLKDSTATTATASTASTAPEAP